MLNILINMQPNILRSTTTLFFIIGLLPRGKISKISFNYTFNIQHSTDRQIDKCPNLSKSSSLVVVGGDDTDGGDMIVLRVLMV